MKVCVVGSGAREHALAYALARTADVVVVPGNPGIDWVAPSGRRVSSVAAPPEEIEADLYVIGPEAPLVDGLADRLRARGGRVFGPSAEGARLEGSKAFMKELVQSAGVPTARFQVVDRIDDAVEFLRTLPGPYVIKADGLAAGKGVFVTSSFDQAVVDADEKLSGRGFGDAGRRLVIEEGLVGPEVSLLVLCDGTNLVALPPARDYKRLGDGDQGPNTGGMGAFCAREVASAATVDAIMDDIVAPTVAELLRRQIDYRGVLYAGCMLTDSGPQLIEYNVRFGDPEAEVVLLRLGGDVTDLLSSAADGQLSMELELTGDPAVCVVLASAGYPMSARTGDRIDGIERAGEFEGVTIFHGGTRYGIDGALETGGGRVLSVSALGGDLITARARAYAAIDRISFDGMQFRHDIADPADNNDGVNSVMTSLPMSQAKAEAS